MLIFLFFSCFFHEFFSIRLDYNAAALTHVNGLLGTTCSASADTSHIVWCPDDTYAVGTQLIGVSSYSVVNILLDCRNLTYDRVNKQMSSASSVIVKYTNLGTMGTKTLIYGNITTCNLNNV